MAHGCGKNKALRYYRFLTYWHRPMSICLTYLFLENLFGNLNLHDFYT